MQFICDAMLGDLARSLRLLGFDTLYVGEMDIERSGGQADPKRMKPLKDEEILELARETGRVVVTQDVAFAERDPTTVFRVHGETLPEMMRELKERFNLRLVFDQERSRCTTCNQRVMRVEKEKVKGLVKEKTYENTEVFYQCPACKKIYWIGAHFKENANGILGRFKDVLDHPR